MFSNPPINLLNSTSVLELGSLVDQIEAEPDLCVVVFASDNPDFFMARYDLSDTNPVAFEPTETGVTLFIDSMQPMRSAGAISIAAVRGRARGGGSEFALSCDLRFASETAIFGQPEVGVGIVPAGGAVELLPGLVGGARALEIIASANDYDAATAERYGLVNRTVSDGDLDEFVEGPSLDQHRETLAALGSLVVSPTTAARRQAVAKHASRVGPDFELRMGHHLAAVGRT